MEEATEAIRNFQRELARALQPPSPEQAALWAQQKETNHGR